MTDQTAHHSRAAIRRQLADLRARLDEAMLADRHRLSKRWRRLQQQIERGALPANELQALLTLVEESVAMRARRAARVPVPTYDEALPIVARRAEIAALIDSHPVVIVCGETGSGKTTQLPKICLELGRGVAGLIGHTQPRRIAARSVCARLAAELEGSVGDIVGYKIRFSDHIRDLTLVKLMTDGILLAETQTDRFLEQYDTIIIDEAHERSLNIDFLLGYLRQLLRKRRDLKVIITSATIDPASFSRHFDNAPVIEVSGRTYPVELRYRPLGEDQDADLNDRIVEAVDELARASSGDVLVFLPGEREIRDAAEALRKHHPPHTELLPLYARLSASEQDRVFKPHGSRRIVLATNIAETSLTVPGIRCVVDTGLARISRYSHRTKVQRLAVEKISQASAEQRKGRCGRVGPGICVRLFSEDDFAAREAYTPPEILRTNLAGVVLRMAALNLGEVEQFPFIDPPDSRYVNDGYRLLHELQAMDEGRELTELGRQLARLPLDPRLARMALAGASEGCLADVLVVAAALSIQDPRERPLDAQQKADAAHAEYKDVRSDFVSLLKLWRAYQEHKKHLSHRKLRQWCRQSFLSLRRLREWEDIHAQLRGLAADLGLRAGESGSSYEALHRALLSGLLGQIACKGVEHEYTGPRGVKLSLHPGSGLYNKRPKWIMAAELVETTRLYARGAAEIAPEWISDVGAHLLKRSYADPHWEKRAGRVVVYESATLFGLLVYSRRKMDYARLDPNGAREIFIREALARFDLITKAGFYTHNQSLVEEVERLEHKSRRPDILIEEDVLCEFYAQRIGQQVVDARSFERWRKRAEASDPRLLYLQREDLMRHAALDITERAYPDTLAVGALRLALEYHFEPGSQADGVSVTVPLAAVNQIDPHAFEWLVPGLLQEKVTALIRALPKSLRRNFVPVPDFARACAEALAGRDGDFYEQLSAVLQRMSGVVIAPNQFSCTALPEHLKMNVRIIDQNGEVVDEGRDFPVLRAALAGRAQAGFGRLPTAQWERAGLVDWTFDELPEVVRVEQNGVVLEGFPTLKDEGDSVRLAVLDSAAAASASLPLGLSRLYQLRCADKVKYLRKNLPGLKQMCLHYAPLAGCRDLVDEIISAGAARAFRTAFQVPRRREQFEDRLAVGRDELVAATNRVAEQVGQALACYHDIAKRLRGSVPPQWLAVLTEVKEHLNHLVYPGFVAATPAECLSHLPRYLQATNLRLEKLAANPTRDRALAVQYAPLWKKFWSHPRAQDYPRPSGFEDYRWLLEELWVSLFAQELGTAHSVSVKRLEADWRDLCRATPND